MGLLLDLPPELLEFIAEHLHDNKAALNALSLVSHALLSISHVQLFKQISILKAPIHDDGNLTGTEEMRMRTSFTYRLPGRVQERQRAQGFFVCFPLHPGVHWIACTPLRTFSTDVTLPLPPYLADESMGSRRVYWFLPFSRRRYHRNAQPLHNGRPLQSPYTPRERTAGARTSCTPTLRGTLQLCEFTAPNNLPWDYLSIGCNTTHCPSPI